MADWNAVFQEKVLGFQEVENFNIGQVCALATKRGSSLLDCIRKSTAVRLRETILLLYSAQVTHISSAGSSAGPPQCQRDEDNGEIPAKRSQDVQRIGALDMWIEAENWAWGRGFVGILSRLLDQWE